MAVSEIFVPLCSKKLNVHCAPIMKILDIRKLEFDFFIELL